LGCKVLRRVGSGLEFTGERLREFFVGLYSSESLRRLPWADSAFDCIFVAIEGEKARPLGVSFASSIVQTNVDYVQTVGPDSEWLHDLVDEEAVLSGRQSAVGDGSPMTTWHDEVVTLEGAAEIAHLCFGSTPYVLCLLTGGEPTLRSFVGALEAELSE
jgi:hypothetical protein